MSTACRASRVLGIAGPSAAGKTTFARAVQASLGCVRSIVICHDDYYRDLAHLPRAQRSEWNFDHPDALETELLVEHLSELRRGRAIRKPLYDLTQHRRRREAESLQPAPVIIVEGILVLAIPSLREAFDLRAYIDTPADICLARRVLRDVRERGRSVESIIEQYLRFVRPMQDEWVLPSRVWADVLVGGDDVAARADEAARQLRAGHPDWTA